MGRSKQQQRHQQPKHGQQRPGQAASTNNSSNHSIDEQLAEHLRVQQEDFRRNVNAMCDLVMDQQSRDLFAALEHVARTVESQVTIIRQLLSHAGTNVELNDQQPYDDGDQRRSPTEPQRQILRTLWSKGADIEHHMIWKAFSPFADDVVRGDAARVRMTLKKAAAAAAAAAASSTLARASVDNNNNTKNNNNKMRQLLEQRCSSLRLSPLVLCVAIQKHPQTVLRHNLDLRAEQLDHVGVAVALLRYGARPDARDVTGKTVVHYGAGGMATPESLIIVDYCIAAARVSAFYGQTIVLDGLKAKPELNGRNVVLTGFDGPTGRCVVQLVDKNNNNNNNNKNTEENKELSIKPCNLFQSLGGPCIEDLERKLVNDQDRTGMTALHEVAMSTRNDVVEFLAGKHHCSMDLKDENGTSIRDMAFNRSLQLHPINQVLKKYAIQLHKKDQQRKDDDKSKTCAHCARQEDSSKNELFYMCSQCKAISYCSQECQHADWKKHKKVCQERSVGIKLDRPKPLPFNLGRPFCINDGKVPNRVAIPSPDNYKVPQGSEVGQVFWVKVQYNSDAADMLVYDKTRTCCFCLAPGSAGFREIADVVKAEVATRGTKTYLKASFDAAGDCTIYPNAKSLKTW
ncbi:hypothetical protein ACA910_014922 [Epithemia clementina (nom. ined.)]